MKLYLLKIKQYCMIIVAMLQVFVLCSCANKEWISGRKEQVFDHYVNNMQKDLDKKFAMLNVSSDKLMDSAKLQTKEINSSTDNFKKLNDKTLKLIKRLQEKRQDHLTKMTAVDKKLRNFCTTDDKIIFKKTFDDVKSMTRKKIQDWEKYSTKVHRFSVEEYTGFFKISTLYKLAELPVKKKMCNPINAKTIQLLNTSIKTIGQKENNLLTINDKLKEDMKLQELLYIYNSLRNCRVAANKLTGGGDIQSWYNEESLIVNSTAGKRKGKDYFQILLYNRIMVCDFMTRRLNSPEEYPMELVYFIYQLKLANNYINDETWKKSISAMIVKYIDRFNRISVMSKKNKI